MMSVVLVGLGGFIGAVLRYLLSGWVQGGSSSFPVGTLTVNVAGSFLLSFIMYTSEFKGFFPEETRIFLTIGVLGAFTTMSTFGYETFRLLEQRELLLSGMNIIGTLGLVMLAVFFGRVAAIGLWRP